MDKETYSDERVVVLSKDYIFAKVNTKEDSLTKKKFNIAFTPTAILVRSNGEEIDRLVGFYPAPEYLGMIKDYRKGKNTLADFEKRVSKNPEDVVLLYTLGDRYQWRANNDKAAEMFGKVVELDPQNKSGKADSSAFNLAFLKYRAKDYQGAIADFEMFKTEYTNPNLVGDAQIYIALSYEKSENKAEAVMQYQKYLEMYPAGENADYAKEHIEKLTAKAEETK